MSKLRRAVSSVECFRTQILGSKDHACMWSALSPKGTSLIRTELIGRRGALIKREQLYRNPNHTPPAMRGYHYCTAPVDM